MGSAGEVVAVSSVSGETRTRKTTSLPSVVSTSLQLCRDDLKDVELRLVKEEMEIAQRDVWSCFKELEKQANRERLKARPVFTLTLLFSPRHIGKVVKRKKTGDNAGDPNTQISVCRKRLETFIAMDISDSSQNTALRDAVDRCWQSLEVLIAVDNPTYATISIVNYVEFIERCETACLKIAALKQMGSEIPFVDLEKNLREILEKTCSSSQVLARKYQEALKHFSRKKGDLVRCRELAAKRNELTTRLIEKETPKNILTIGEALEKLHRQHDAESSIFDALSTLIEALRRVEEITLTQMESLTFIDHLPNLFKGKKSQPEKPLLDALEVLNAIPAEQFEVSNITRKEVDALAKGIKESCEKFANLDETNEETDSQLNELKGELKAHLVKAKMLKDKNRIEETKELIDLRERELYNAGKKYVETELRREFLLKMDDFSPRKKLVKSSVVVEWEASTEGRKLLRPDWDTLRDPQLQENIGVKLFGWRNSRDIEEQVVVVMGGSSAERSKLLNNMFNQLFYSTESGASPECEFEMEPRDPESLGPQKDIMEYRLLEFERHFEKDLSITLVNTPGFGYSFKDNVTAFGALQTWLENRRVTSFVWIEEMEYSRLPDEIHPILQYPRRLMEHLLGRERIKVVEPPSTNMRTYTIHVDGDQQKCDDLWSKEVVQIPAGATGEIIALVLKELHAVMQAIDTECSPHNSLENLVMETDQSTIKEMADKLLSDRTIRRKIRKVKGLGSISEQFLQEIGENSSFSNLKSTVMMGNGGGFATDVLYHGLCIDLLKELLKQDFSNDTLSSTMSVGTGSADATANHTNTGIVTTSAVTIPTPPEVGATAGTGSADAAANHTHSGIVTTSAVTIATPPEVGVTAGEPAIPATLEVGATGAAANPVPPRVGGNDVPKIPPPPPPPAVRGDNAAAYPGTPGVGSVNAAAHPVSPGVGTVVITAATGKPGTGNKDEAEKTVPPRAGDSDLGAQE